MYDNYARKSDLDHILSLDTRDIATTPGSYTPSLRVNFKKNATNSLSDGGTYNTELWVKGYGSTTDFSGGYPHQLGFTHNGNIWHRVGTGATAWGAWRKLLDSDNTRISAGVITINGVSITPLIAHQSVVNKAATLAWDTAVTIATIGDKDITAKLPANPNTDTKNTAGSTNTSSKIFLIGATSQAASPQTYSHDTAYVGTDGCLYSGGTKVLTAHQSLDNYYTRTETNNGFLHTADGMKYAGSLNDNARPAAYRIRTTWPEANGNGMPLINIRGYAYGAQGTIDIDIVSYQFNDKYTNFGAVSKGSWRPENIYITAEDGMTVIYLVPETPLYYCQFHVFVYRGQGMNRQHMEGWTVEALSAKPTVADAMQLIPWKSMSATAANALQLGGTAASEYLTKSNYATVLDTRYYTESEINAKLTDGSVTKVGTATVGAANRPIYLNAGTPTQCSYIFGNASGNAALNNGTLNTNLNADKLDGLHADDIRKSVLGFKNVPAVSSAGANDLDTILQDGGMISNYGGMSYWGNAPAGMSYGSALCLRQYTNSYLYGMLAWDINHNSATDITRNLYWRAYSGHTTVANNGWGKWHQIAFTDGNVASATNADMVDGLHATALFATRNLFSKKDYQHYVVLLWKVNEVAVHRINGKIYTRYTGSSRYQAADIDMWYSRWSAGFDKNLRLDTFGLGTAWRLITCTYNSESWYALQHTNAQACQAYFVGTSENIDFTAVHYYTSNPAAVVNSSVNSSITDKTSELSKPFVGNNAYALVSDNVASATKLATPHNIWGRPFDGTANVTGDLTNVISITMSGNIYMAHSKLLDAADALGIYTDSGAAKKVLTGGLLVSSSYSAEEKAKIPAYGIYVRNAIRIGEITISYNAANKGLEVSGGGLYTDSYLSAKGADTTSGTGSSFGLMVAWPSAAPGADTDDALGANLGYALYRDKADKSATNALASRIAALEGKNYLNELNLAQSGSGNAVTAVALSADKKTITVTKGSTFLTSANLTPYLTKTDAQSLYQPKGSYLTSHQPLDYINVKDVRGETRLPSYFGDKKVSAWFNNTGTPTSAWYAGIHVKGWSGGYASWELAAGSHVNVTDKGLYFRVGINDTWEAWQTVLTSLNTNISGGVITINGSSITPLVQHQSVSNKAATLSWDSTVTIATVGGTSITAKLPANPNTDTKDTAGAANTTDKIFLIGAKTQPPGGGIPTYSHDTVYVGTDGCVYSGGKKVLTAHQSLDSYYTRTEARQMFVKRAGDAMAGTLGTCSVSGQWITGLSDAAIRYYNLNAISSGSFHSFLGMRSSSGHVLTFGALNDNIGFYTFLADRTENGYDSYFQCNTATGAWTTGSSFTAARFIKSDGTASQFLMADGSVKPLTDITSAYVTALGTLNNSLTWTKNGVSHAITVPYATKAAQLQTARTLWGQSFDGRGNVTGALTSVSDITMTGALNIGPAKLVYNTDNEGLHLSGAGLYTDSYLTAKALGTDSDMRLKKRLHGIDIDVAVIASIDVFEFAWRDGRGLSAGCSAQQLEKIFSHTVYRNKRGYRAVDYGRSAMMGLVPVAKKTLALAKWSEDHERRIRRLESENRALREEVRNLKCRMQNA